MDLPAPLAWLFDKAGASPGPEQFLAELGGRLLAHGLPLTGGALTLAVPHPIIARRTWLCRAETGAVIEALGFGSMNPAGSERGKVGRDWLARLGAGPVQEDGAGPPAGGSSASGPLLAWALSRPLAERESALLREAARFAAAPLAGLSWRAMLAALLEAYVGRRGAAQVLAGRSRREAGETLRAVLLFGDLRGFDELSESMAPEAVVAALDAWFDRIAGAVHAFGGEVLKFIGDGVLAIFPIAEQPPSAACDAALRAVAAARAGMAHLDQARRQQGLP
jgi:adenylate cyclase